MLKRLWLLLSRRRVGVISPPAVSAGPCHQCGRELYFDITDPRGDWFDIARGPANYICKSVGYTYPSGVVQTHTWLHSPYVGSSTIYQERTIYDLPDDTTQEGIERWLST